MIFATAQVLCTFKVVGWKHNVVLRVECFAGFVAIAISDSNRKLHITSNLNALALRICCDFTSQFVSKCGLYIDLGEFLPIWAAQFEIISDLRFVEASRHK